MIFVALHFCLAFSAILLESFCSNQTLWVSITGIYIFYLCISKSWRVAFIAACIIASIQYAISHQVIYLPAFLLYILVAEWWNNVGNYSSAIHQVIPLVPCTFINVLLTIAINDSALASNAYIIALLSSFATSFAALILFSFWDFLSDRCELSRYSQRDEDSPLL